MIVIGVISVPDEARFDRVIVWNGVVALFLLGGVVSLVSSCLRWLVNTRERLNSSDAKPTGSRLKACSSDESDERRL